MSLQDIKFMFQAGAYNLIDSMRHPILHLTDGKGLGVPLRQRSEVGVKVRTKLVARDRNGRVTGVRYSDMAVIGLAQFIQANILATAETIKDTGGTNRSISANTSTGTLRVVVGTTGTAPTFTDNALGAQSAGTSGYMSATVNAISGSQFTVTGTITNSSGNSITYAEMGETLVAATYTFLLSHSTFTGLPVSNGGQLACTDTWSFS
jgi:hypothetical protein